MTTRTRRTARSRALGAAHALRAAPRRAAVDGGVDVLRRAVPGGDDRPEVGGPGPRRQADETEDEADVGDAG